MISDKFKFYYLELIMKFIFLGDKISNKKYFDLLKNNTYKKLEIKEKEIK